MNGEEYKATAAFFTKWSLAMLADFYEYERNALGKVYLSIEEEYIKEHSEIAQIVKFLIEKKELWSAISFLIKDSTLEQSPNADEEEYLIKYISQLPEHCKIILTALSRGFLLEWLYFNMGIGDCPLVLSEGEAIAGDRDYGEWKRAFCRMTICRAEMVTNANYASYYFYYRVLKKRVWDSLFDWLHSKDIKDGFKEELIEMSCTLMSFEDISSKYEHRCKLKEWKPILKVPKLPLPDAIDTERAQFYFRKAIKNKLIKQKGYIYEWKGGSKTLLVYFCSRIYCGDMALNGFWTKGTDPQTGEDMNFSNTETLEWTFGVKNMGGTRRKRLDQTAPKGYEKVDELFKE